MELAALSATQREAAEVPGRVPFRLEKGDWEEDEIVKKRLESEMEARLRKDQDPRMSGQGAIFESYKYLGGRAHSYDNWLKFRQ